MILDSGQRDQARSRRHLGRDPLRWPRHEGRPVSPAPGVRASPGGGRAVFHASMAPCRSRAFTSGTMAPDSVGQRADAGSQLLRPGAGQQHALAVPAPARRPFEVHARDLPRRLAETDEAALEPEAAGFGKAHRRRSASGRAGVPACREGGCLFGARSSTMVGAISASVARTCASSSTRMSVASSRTSIKRFRVRR